MDPTTCRDEMRDARRSGDFELCWFAADALVGWLAEGGFAPQGQTAADARREASRMRAWAARMSHRRSFVS